MPDHSIVVCIVSDDTVMSGKVRRLLVQEGFESSPDDVVTLDAAANHVAQISPNLVVVILGSDPKRGMAVMAGLHVRPPTRVVAVGPASDPRLVILSLRSGADDYVDQDDLETSFHEALPRCRSAVVFPREPGRIIALFAPSGGSGTSTLAANLATALTKRRTEGDLKADAGPRDVLLMDLNLEAGDLAPLLDLKPSHDIAELSQNVSRMDLSLLRITLENHTSGVHLLSAPKRIADAQYVTSDAVKQILKIGQLGFEYVVVDVAHSFQDVQMQVLRQAAVILMVLRMDFTAIRNTRRALEYLDEIGVDKSRVQLVANRFGQPKEVDEPRAEEALGMKVKHSIPDDAWTVNRSNNNGEPLVLSAPTSKIAKSIFKMAESLERLGVTL